MKEKCAGPHAPDGVEGPTTDQPTTPHSLDVSGDGSCGPEPETSATPGHSGVAGDATGRLNNLSSAGVSATGAAQPAWHVANPAAWPSAGRAGASPARHGTGITNNHHPASRVSPNSSTHVEGPRGAPYPASDFTNGAVYGALDLGTNNCRLLLARPSRRGFRVVDAFSRIIRLGEGVACTGQLSEAAMTRTIEALRVCAAKLERHQVTRARFVATEACRIAENGMDFIDRVRERCGLEIEVLNPELEARLAVSGCSSLVDSSADYVLVFDIGGGSSEIIWLDLTRDGARRRGPSGRIAADAAIAAWTSLPVGVVTLAERFDGRSVTHDDFETMVSIVTGLLAPFEADHRFGARIEGRGVHFLGTSGTVTTIAGILLGLPRYDRNKVDGSWLAVPEISSVTQGLLGKTYAERVAEPCIGRERADLVLAGCAILEAVLRMWPAQRLRVADRGLREGILTTLMMEDGVWRHGRRRRRSRGN
ncbi:MAG TPA: Ppx/GppA phosphatase family protein [Hyphomicrobium sp.]|nr:Ppx/GppA phosphatase family protein [Hyphomicrobium sp.]